MNINSNKYQPLIVQIATSHSEKGTGFYWHDYGVIVTQEHIVHDHQTAIIASDNLPPQLTDILFTDQLHNVALLFAPEQLKSNISSLSLATTVNVGEVVSVIGHPFGEDLKTAFGTIQQVEEEGYLQHDAALSGDYNGSLLLNQKGDVLGISSFLWQEDRYLGFALPIAEVVKIIKAYQEGKGKKGVRCMDCQTIVFESNRRTRYCSNCGTDVIFLSNIQEYEPFGISKTIEDIIRRMGHKVKLARRASYNWEILEGSAKVVISYHEDSGLIIGDAYLCLLPNQNLKAIYQYLLRQNKDIERLTFSLDPNSREIILSLLIYDRYLNVDIGIQLFQHLLERADYYDNILVEEFGAEWV